MGRRQCSAGQSLCWAARAAVAVAEAGLSLLSTARACCGCGILQDLWAVLLYGLPDFGKREILSGTECLFCCSMAHQTQAAPSEIPDLHLVARAPGNMWSLPWQVHAQHPHSQLSISSLAMQPVLGLQLELGLCPLHRPLWLTDAQLNTSPKPSHPA